MDGVARGYAKMGVTPKSLRMRKILLDENDRKKAGEGGDGAVSQLQLKSGTPTIGSAFYVFAMNSGMA